jgi:hypothetical protein
MLTRVIIALALSLLTGSVAEAQVWRSGGAFGVFRSVGTVQGNFPLDGFATQPTACYSERRLRSAYVTDAAINIVRASDSAVLDIGFLSGGPNTAAEATFCAATTCKLVTAYDQCGSRNLTQATDANRYTRQAGPSTFMASQATAQTQTHAAASAITPATGVVSLAAVHNRSVGTGVCHVIRENGANNLILTRNAQVGLVLTGGTSGTIATGSADATWHGMAGAINGASSAFVVDGVDTGTNLSPIGNTTSVVPAIRGGTSSTCNWLESIIWDNYVLTSSQMIYISNNQRTAFQF